MKIPASPPPETRLVDIIESHDTDKIRRLFGASLGPCDGKGRYLHWDKLRHLPPPPGFDAELYWLVIKNARAKIAKPLPFLDKLGQQFSYAVPDAVMRDVLWISENATGAIGGDPRIVDAKTKQTYLINSLIEEAISSSQLEGAATTRRVAKEMIRSGRQPKSHSEKMILNNYHAMVFIRDYKEETLTPSMIFELHKILTEGTLKEEDADKAGKFRADADEICVASHDDIVLHVSPPAGELAERLQKICDFANKTGEDGSTYIPPILRAIIVHFMIGYDHPFVDGNGRTARALFYWLMAKEKYWLMEFISLSRVLKKAPSKYMQAYLYTETDANDTTYFIIHQLEAIKQAIADLHDYLNAKSTELREAEEVLEHSPLKGELNHRQLSILKNALKNPGAEYTVKSHQKSHGVAYQTARTDLLTLSDNYGVLKKFKVGKKDVFISPRDIRGIVAEMGK